MPYTRTMTATATVTKSNAEENWLGAGWGWSASASSNLFGSFSADGGGVTGNVPGYHGATVWDPIISDHPADRTCTGATLTISISAELSIKPYLSFLDPHPGPDNEGDGPNPPNSPRQVRGGYSTFYNGDVTVELSGTAHWIYTEGGAPAPDTHYAFTGAVPMAGQPFPPALPYVQSGCEADTANNGWGYRTFGSGSATMTVDGQDNSISPANGGAEHPAIVYSGTDWTAYMDGDDGNGGGLTVGPPVRIGLDASAADLEGAAIPYFASLGPQAPYPVEGTLPQSYLSPIYHNYLGKYDGEGYTVDGFANKAASADAVLPADRSRDPSTGWYGEFECGPTGGIPCTFPEGPTWTPFSLGRVATLAVDDMSDSHPLGYRWTSGTYGGGVRTVTGVTSFSRSLKSDWNEIRSGPPDTWATNHLSSGTTDQRRAATYIKSRKTWYQVKRRVAADSDVTDWDNHRWLKISGSGTASFTVRIRYDLVSISDDYSPAALPPTGTRAATATVTPATVDVTGLTFGAAPTSLYIDLAEVANRTGASLGHVQQIEIRDMTAGATYTFSGISLASGEVNATPYSVNEAAATWGYWTGIPYSEDAALIPFCDGRRCLAQDPGNQIAAGIGYIEYIDTPAYGSPRGGDRAVTREAFIEDLWAQGEGFTVTPGSASPDASMGWPAGSFDWAIWLDAGWHAAGGAATARYKFLHPSVEAPFYATFTAALTAHARLCGLAWDVTGAPWPARAQTVRLMKGPDHDPPTDWPDGGDGFTETELPLGIVTTDNNGAWTVPSAAPAHLTALERWLDDPYMASRTWFPETGRYRFAGVTVMDAGTPANPAQGGTFGAQNRGIGYSEMRGLAAAASGGSVSLHVNGPGWEHRAYTVAGNFQVERRMPSGGEWTLIGSKAGAHPSVTVDVHGAVQVAYVLSGNVRLWDLGTGEDGIVATGTRCAHRWNRGWSLKALARWTGGAIWVDVTDGQGNLLRSVNAATAPEQTPGIDWRVDGSLELAYSDGTNALAKVSQDNGATWA